MDVTVPPGLGAGQLVGALRTPEPPHARVLRAADVAPGAPSVPRSPVNACFLVVAALAIFALGAARGDAQLAVEGALLVGLQLAVFSGASRLIVL